MGRIPEFLDRAITANPELGLVVCQFIEAVSQFDKTGQKLARLVKEIEGAELSCFRGIKIRRPKLQQRGDLSRPHHDPHKVEPDHIPDPPCINPVLLEKQGEPLSEGLLSHGSDDRLERLTLGDLGRNWNNNSLPSTDTMRNLEDNGNPDISSSNVRGIAAISSLTSIETADYSTPEIKKVATRANMQPSVYDVSDENNNIILQTGRASPTGCDENMQPSVEGVNDEGEEIVPQKKRVRPTGDGENMQASVEDVSGEGNDILPQKKRVRPTGDGGRLRQPGPRKNSSLKKSSEAKSYARSTAQKISHQQADASHSVTRYSAYDQMRCLFGSGKEEEEELSESAFIRVLELCTKGSRPDLASFLENLSDLWRTNQFWSPDPLHLSMPEDLPAGASCLRLFRYLRDLGKETKFNVIRRRFAQLKLHLSFIHLCDDMANPESHNYKTGLNRRRIPSHAIDKLMGLEGGDRYSENPLASKDRRHFVNTNARGRRWYLISHYIGWGALIIFNNIDTAIGKIDLIELEAFIIYVLNTQPRVVALCRTYEQPVKDLLNGKKPALTLTEKEVRGTIDGLPHTIDSDGCANTPWKRINTKIDTDVSEVVGHT
ncbi:conserved serine-proline rich protein [Talaromyces stipitatus ATCC 10500]|uniref:Conserved serine-proline rich protein n=1 Tax=Talaromyces stipitatus (strain ATCC 10500 / CBS 375.48 / QM 6759 / NRRL 1006) TaxID=441959 RepID=B8MFU7_TALSN|nr:conserved serine-proline rich protein [Talaromyces stipitatus ATCC 10500]EED15814.1 conserved serine-proline rich protein [Talaromyces stipitatus ATCC 10500]